MKDSGIEWIGEIPDDWKISKIYSLYSLRSTKVNDKDYPPLSVTKKGILPQLKNVAKTDDHNNRKLVLEGDFVINSRSDRRGSCGISNYNGSVSLINIVLKPTSDMYNRYFNQLFHTELFADEFYKYGHGIVDDLWTTIWQDMKKISVCIPPLDEQQQIADFLDNKCSKIDKLLELLTKQIKVLSEYKKSLITETVTKGLNPDKLAPSTKEEKNWKDSGINWIGEIPKDWKISRLKYLLDCPMKYGASETGITYNENLPRYIRITDITQDNKLKNEGKLSLTFEQAKGYILTTDSILFARSGATVGKTFLYLPKYGLCAFAGYLISATPNKNLMIAKWLYYYSQSNSYWNWVNTIFTQATIQNIGADKYNNMKIPLPPLEEQQEIADFLDNKCSKIDKLLENKKKQIETLKKYKKSLIYEYVTGKKEIN